MITTSRRTLRLCILVPLEALLKDEVVVMPK